MVGHGRLKVPPSCECVFSSSSSASSASSSSRPSSKLLTGSRNEVYGLSGGTVVRGTPSHTGLSLVPVMVGFLLWVDERSTPAALCSVTGRRPRSGWGAPCLGWHTSLCSSSFLPPLPELSFFSHASRYTDRIETRTVGLLSTAIAANILVYLPVFF